MHYFLGLEVWQEPEHIFLGQGKYAIDILKRFQLEDCRPMSTPMITYWKKLNASESELVDPIILLNIFINQNLVADLNKSEQN
jgi:hypothetical protein